MKQLMNVTFAPHIRSSMDTFKIMLFVIISLLPAVIISIINYGLYAFTLYAACIISAVFLEHIFCKIQGIKTTINDLSAVLTGLLFALTLPPNLPLWTAFIGVFFAIIVAKMVFGGIGQNPFNPALTGRIVLLVSFPALMTSFQAPLYSNIDVLSGATILGNAKTDLSAYGIINHINIDYHQLLISAGGSLGEISPLALIIGGLFLMYKIPCLRAAKYTQIQTASVFVSVCHCRILTHLASRTLIPGTPIPNWGGLWHFLPSHFCSWCFSQK